MAKVHFNQFSEEHGRFGRRLIYDGHVISLARALSFKGLAAIDGGRHVAPLFAGGTVFAWSKIIEAAALLHDEKRQGRHFRLDCLCKALHVRRSLWGDDAMFGQVTA
jgi:acyl dehydratase